MSVSTPRPPSRGRSLDNTAAFLLGGLVLVLFVAGVATALFSGPSRGSSSAAAAFCDRVAESAKGRTAARADLDLPLAIRSGGLAPMPVLGSPHEHLASEGGAPNGFRYTESSFVPLVADRTLWTALLRDGWRDVWVVRYGEQTTHLAEAVRLGSPGQASQFNAVTLKSLCEAGDVASAHSVPGVPGAVTFTYDAAHAPDVPTHWAAFVVGDTVVRLGVCDCPGVPDGELLAGEWAHRVSAQYRAGTRPDWKQVEKGLLVMVIAGIVLALGLVVKGVPRNRSVVYRAVAAGIGVLSLALVFHGLFQRVVS